MDIYLFCMLLGFAGLIAMAFSGLSHGTGGHALGGHAHGGHLPGLGSHGAGSGHALHGPHAPSAGHATGHGAHPHPGNQQPTAQTIGEAQSAPVPASSSNFAAAAGASAMSGALLAWVSPRALFSVLLGFGAVGTLVHVMVHEPAAMALAAMGGLGFEGLLVRPLWNLLLGFASKPARTLEDAVAEEARAVSNFDANGYGLIALEMDGQTRQVLGSLRPADRDAGVRVRTGDILFVESVDTKRNSCVVSSLGRQHTV